jgi:hypothetical protein
MKSTNEILFYTEGLRETGILILVFGPLSAYFDSPQTGWSFYATMLFFLCLGAGLFYVGVRLEVKGQIRRQT